MSGEVIMFCISNSKLGYETLKKSLYAKHVLRIGGLCISSLITDQFQIALTAVINVLMLLYFQEEDDDDMFTDDVMSSKAVARAITVGSLSDKANMDFLNLGTSPGFSHVT